MTRIASNLYALPRAVLSSKLFPLLETETQPIVAAEAADTRRTGLYICPEHLEAPALPARVHLDRFFREAHTRVRCAREGKEGELKEEQTVHICAIPWVVREVDSPAHPLSVPRSKHPPHGRSVQNYSVLYVIDDPQ